jgi:hypothetical protein
MPMHSPHDPSRAHNHLDNPDNTDPRPYWKRAHHDWRFWIAMVLMVAAISTYVLTQDLRLRPAGTRIAPTPAALP